MYTEETVYEREMRLEREIRILSARLNSKIHELEMLDRAKPNPFAGYELSYDVCKVCPNYKDGLQTCNCSAMNPTSYTVVTF